MLSKSEAHLIADILKDTGGYAWHSGGGVWLVRFDRQNGSFVLLGYGEVGEYENDDDEGQDIYFGE